jgi:hypothetical protein
MIGGRTNCLEAIAFIGDAAALLRERMPSATIGKDALKQQGSA